jgi:hypothetical protein
MSDKPMRDNQDPILMRLFAERDLPLPADDFMAQITMQLEQERRKQHRNSIATVVAIVAGTALFIPWIAQAMAIALHLVDEYFEASGGFLQSPVTWLAGGALVFACLPIIYVWRAFRG